MRTIFINHLNQGKTKRSLFGKYITEYDSHEGVIKEICPKTGNRPPKYVIKRTKEPVNVIIV